MPLTSPSYGGIEAGGTKFVCAVGASPGDLRDETRIDTTTPDETLSRCIDFFLAREVDAVGIASFGPLDPDPPSPTFGYITTTPKPGWANVDFAGTIQRALNVPVGFDTDVNGAALGEYRWGAAQGLDTFLYLTVGTGVGGGGLVNGKLMHGLIHPEMGHIRVPQDRAVDPYQGACPYHGNCLEGLTSGVAIEKRWGVPASELPPEHPAWRLEADYLAHALANFACTLSPQRIILGGGVMDQSHLFPMIRERVANLLNGYIQNAAILDRMDEFIAPPGLGNKSGVLGAIALAERASGER
ncbi:MAG: ROK family protein [Candidatus Poribacteria bacterium]|nr:ROK family protein [Candidatus Poribacteria bacterium]